MRAERKPPQRAEPPALLALRHSLNVSAAFAKHDPARGPPHGPAEICDGSGGAPPPAFAGSPLRDFILFKVACDEDLG